MISTILLVVAIICFALVAIGASIGTDLIAIGLAFFAAAHLPWGNVGVNVRG